jgi:stalled ribosome rescue protein Dom34
MKRRRGYKRGYPVALLVGLEADHAILWQVFSYVAKPYQTLKIDGKRSEDKVMYNFYESVVEALRPLLEEGVRAVVVASSTRTTYASDFLSHVRKHHRYLILRRQDGAVFAKIVGSADKPNQVAELARTKEFHRIISETTSEEAGQIINMLEKNLYSPNSNVVVLFSFREIEGKVYDHDKSPDDSRDEYLLLTNKYLEASKEKNKLHRLLQISKNKNVKTRILDAETSAGRRLTQLGGIVFFSTSRALLCSSES